MPGRIGAYADPATLDAVDTQIDQGQQAADEFHAQAQAARTDELNSLRQSFMQTAQQNLARFNEMNTMRESFMNAATAPVPPKVNATPVGGSSPATPNQREDRPGMATGPGGSMQNDVGGLVPAQYGPGQQLTAAEANAACGPAAAVAFARAYGRNPTMREAVDLAGQMGWTTNGGMNGVANEKSLMDKLNIPNHLEGQADWSKIAQDATNGNPVAISTPQHYFVVDGFAAGKYHVGNSGTAVQSLGGGEWMTPQQIEKVGRGVNGVIYADHPLASGPSITEPGTKTDEGQS